MILIVRGPHGQRRVQVEDAQAIGPQLKKTFEVVSLRIFMQPDAVEEVDIEQSPDALELKNGSVMYVQYDVHVSIPNDNRSEPVPQDLLVSEGSTRKRTTERGIHRGRDEMMCQHDSRAMCSHCAPLDPWDERYHKENMIKYLSFGSYKEMMKSNKKEMCAESYIVVVCSDHGQNTRCTRCQERSIILMPQTFRMIDHVEFDGQHHVENFIKGWKDSRRQRFGFLVGKYIGYDLVPLGMKAVVSGIWEPEQENYPDGFVLLDESNDFLHGSGLEVIGMIYTDIHMEGGEMMSDKLARDYFLSSLEIQFIATMQQKHPYVIADGNKKDEFGSRFVTIVATADTEGNVVLMEYQVSTQCMALVKENAILATEEPRMFMAAKDIVYRTKSNAEMVKANPYFLGDFFIVRLTHGCLHTPMFSNEEYVPGKMSRKRMAEFFEGDFSMYKLSSFSLLMKLRGVFGKWKELFKSIVENDSRMFEEVLSSKEFKGFATELDKYACKSWACSRCTFINEGGPNECNICGTEKM
ncbi:nuclear pore protein [Ordospora colligata]|nr:nuclear pore protein [Ordospora colligata]